MFTQVRQKMQNHFEEMVKVGTLFQVSIDRDKIWDIYLQSFEESKRQMNNCRYCRAFLRSSAGIVAIKDGKRISLWDFEPDDPEYNAAIAALRKYVNDLPITDVFLSDSRSCGTDKNFDVEADHYWHHWYLAYPSKVVTSKTSLGAKLNDFRTGKELLERGCKEITLDAAETVLELIQQGSLYRGTEFKPQVKKFVAIKKKADGIKNRKEKQNFFWVTSVSESPAVARIKNSAIGTLLENLSADMELDAAVKAFERVVAPANYKRPTALVTPKMVDAAKKRLEELNLVGALERRVLSDTDLTVNNSLFTYRRRGVSVLDVFEEAKTTSVINPKSLSKVEEVSAEDFVEKILPTAKCVRLLLENRHFGNFATLTGPKNPEDGNLFKWDNSFAWTYTGSVADSIKDRVKAAGGKVDGVLRISLSWLNTDDLDLHLYEPNGYRIYYGNKRTLSPSGGMLDVDCNISGESTEPVENIFWTNKPKNFGEYRVVVNNFNCRNPRANSGGFDVEIEYEGEVTTYSHRSNCLTGCNF